MWKSRLLLCKTWNHIISCSKCAFCHIKIYFNTSKEIYGSLLPGGSDSKRLKWTLIGVKHQMDLWLHLSWHSWRTIKYSSEGNLHSIYKILNIVFHIYLFICSINICFLESQKMWYNLKTPNYFFYSFQHASLL